MDAPGFSLLNDGEVVDVTFNAPQATIATVTLLPPEIAGGWTVQQWPSFESARKFGTTSVKAYAYAEFGKAAKVSLLAGTDVNLKYRLERRKPDSTREFYEAAEKLARDDPRLVNGGTIQLGLPRNENQRTQLGADGVEIRNVPTSREARVSE